MAEKVEQKRCPNCGFIMCFMETVPIVPNYYMFALELKCGCGYPTNIRAWDQDCLNRFIDIWGRQNADNEIRRQFLRLLLLKSLLGNQP